MYQTDKGGRLAMDKKGLARQAYIKALEKKLEKARNSYEIARKDTIEAEGRMVTRYDSTKTETAWLADGYLKEVKELEHCIESMAHGREYANLSDKVSIDRITGAGYEKTLEYILARDGEQRIPEHLFISVIGSVPGDVISVEENKQHVEYQVRTIEKGKTDERAAIESIVTVEDEYGDEDQYFIVNHVGGVEVEAEGNLIFCVSKQAPIAKALLGRKKGEQVVIDLGKEQTFLVKDVQ